MDKILKKAKDKNGKLPCGSCHLCKKAIELQDHRPAIGCFQRYREYIPNLIYLTHPITRTSNMPEIPERLQPYVWLVTTRSR